MIDKDNNIIAGNGIVEAAGQVGLENVKIVETDGTEIIAVKRTDMELASAGFLFYNKIMENETTRKQILLNKKGTKNDGRSKLPEYKIWKGMRTRCYNHNNKKFANYGGRGITICERWNNFWNFYHDMGKRPEGCSIDRIDVNKGYSPNNCRWATVETQENNRTTTRFVTIGKETKSIKQWANLYEISDNTVRDRIYRGWDIMKAITTPARKGNYNGPRKAER